MAAKKDRPTPSRELRISILQAFMKGEAPIALHMNADSNTRLIADDDLQQLRSLAGELKDEGINPTAKDIDRALKQRSNSSD
jgi:hypothetical protein